MQRRSEPVRPAGEWAVWAVAPGEVQCYPRDDLVAHDLTEGECVCGPAVELLETCLFTGGRDAWMFTHQALDGRA